MGEGSAFPLLIPHPPGYARIKGSSATRYLKDWPDWENLLWAISSALSFMLLYINDKGELLNFVITQGNVDDREPLKDPNFIKALSGKQYADKGYISKELTNLLFLDGLHLITSIRNNMKNSLMELKDKILLRKRSVIEIVNDELKNMCQIEHSRHRSFANFITNLISGLIAYSFFPKKPAIKYDPVNTSQITLF